MPKVKLSVNRVCYVPKDRRRFVSESAGQVVECSDKEAFTLVDREQATLVEGETIDMSKVDAGSEPSDPDDDLDPESGSDLVLLELTADQIALLESEDGNGKVPAFGSLSELIIWVQDEGNSLSSKKGIGKKTETTVLAAIDDWVEAQTPNETE